MTNYVWIYCKIHTNKTDFEILHSFHLRNQIQQKKRDKNLINKHEK